MIIINIRFFRTQISYKHEYNMFFNEINVAFVVKHCTENASFNDFLMLTVV